MEVRLLGPVGVWCAGQEVALARSQRRCVLAVLAMTPGQPVPTEVLVDRVWGDHPPREALHSLYTHVSAVRRALGQPGPDDGPQLVRRVARGYVLEIDPERVDLHLARRQATAAREIAGKDLASDNRAVELLRATCALWRGTPLGGLPGDWAARVRTGLDQERLAVMEERFTIELRLGNHAAVMGELAALVADHPLAESLAGLQMLALYRCGRQADALSRYAEIRRRLVAELGDEPGAALRQLHEQILRRDHTLDPPAAGASTTNAVVTPAAAPVPPAQLPADVSTFTGRHEQLARLDTLLAEARDRPTSVVISTFSGTAGVGKTALAVHWAHRVRQHFPDGQLFLDLHGYTQGLEPIEPAEALDRVLRTLGVPGAQIPTSMDGRAALYRTRLADRQMLVVLDNVATEAQVQPLLPGGPGCLVLVTSRNRLAGLDHTHALPLDMLPAADAVTLFLRTAGEGRLATERPELVAETVELCGRLPLAIRIAAARLRSHTTWSLADLVERLRDQRHRLVELEAGQRSVAAALDLSYQHLGHDQQHTYRLLGLHPGPDIDAYATAALLDSTVIHARRMLDHLLDAHLLLEPVAGRYRFHDLIRTHAAAAADRDEAGPAGHAALDRLLDYYRHAASLAMDAAYPYERERRPEVPPARTALPDVAGPAPALGWLGTELPNLLATARYAAEHGRPAHILHLSAILHRHLRTRGRNSDAEILHHRALAAVRATADRTGEVDPLIGLGVICRRQGRYAQATDHFEQALRIAQDTVHRTGELDALTGLGQVHLLQGRYAQAADHFARAVQVDRDTGDHAGQPEALIGLGWVHWLQGRYPQAVDHLEQALRIARIAGHHANELDALTGLGHIHRMRGQYPRAVDHLEQALQIARTTGHRTGELTAQASLGHVHRQQDQPAKAAEHYQQLLHIARETGDHNGQFEALQGLGRLQHAVGHPDAAADYHDRALALAGELGQPDDQARAHDGLAHAYHALHQPEPARQHWQHALDILHRLGVDHTDDEEANVTTIRAQLAELDTSGNGGRREVTNGIPRTRGPGGCRPAPEGG